MRLPMTSAGPEKDTPDLGVPDAVVGDQDLPDHLAADGTDPATAEAVVGDAQVLEVGAPQRAVDRVVDGAALADVGQPDVTVERRALEVEDVRAIDDQGPRVVLERQTVEHDVVGERDGQRGLEAADPAVDA